MSANVQAIFWALLATGLFALTAALAKVAVQDYHVLQILFFRQVVVFVSAIPDLARSFPDSLKTRHPVGHGFRLAGAFVALSCGIWAVAVLPLTAAITIGFAQVFFVTLLATWFLRETVGHHRLIAVIAGFVGVIVVMRPGLDGIIDTAALIPLAGALGAAVAVVSVRRLSQTESTATLLAYQSIFVGVLAGIPLFWFWTNPDIEGFALLLGMGVLATLGQWIGVKALRLGEASVVSNIEYMKLFYAAVFGYLLFAEVPDRYTLLGAAIIVIAALYIARRESSQAPSR